MLGNTRRAPRAVLRVLLWTLAAGFGAVLTMLAATSATASASSSHDDTAPLSGLLGDVTGGATTPLTDALAPATAPVERAAAPVTKPVRAALTADARSTSPDAIDRDTRQPAAAGPSTPQHASTERESSSATDEAADSSSETPDSSATTDDDAAAKDVEDTAENTPASEGVDDVQVSDLDFGPRPLAADHHDHHGTLTAVTGAIGVVGLDDAVTPSVGRDDLLVAVLAPRDTAQGSQSFTRPDVSPG